MRSFTKVPRLVIVATIIALAVIRIGSSALPAEAAPPSNFRIPLVGHAFWYSRPEHVPSPLARDISPRSPNPWDGTVVASASGKVIYAQFCCFDSHGNYLPNASYGNLVIL